MPLKCHIFQLLFVQISDNNVRIYASYQLTAINNVTTSTGIYTFHIFWHMPLNNMSATLHIYFLLHFYCSIHIDPTLLYVKVKTQQTATFNYNAITIYVPIIDMPLKCPICQYVMCRYQTCVSINNPYMNSLKTAI